MNTDSGTRFVLLLLLFTLLPSLRTEAQLIQRYHSQQEIATARTVAKDSIGAEAKLIAIATAGEIDLSAIGFPGTFAGFEEANGTSSVWAYQFSTPDGLQEGAVVVINSGLFPQIRRVERGNLYGVAPREVPVDEMYSDSDQLVARLRTNSLFTSFRAEFPGMLADAVVYTWEPDEELVSIPNDFATDAPIWGVFYNTDDWEEGDSSMVCFVASGTGQTYCERSGVTTSVRSSSTPAEVSTVTLWGNPMRRETGPVASLEIRLAPASTLEQLGLYDRTGRLLLDLRSELPDVVEPGTSYRLILPVAELPAGTYIVRLRDSGAVTTTQFVLE